MTPVINENDTVATEEIRYGDNDRLAARVAQMVGADLLVLLSDIDGLYSADPRRDADATHISLVSELTPRSTPWPAGSIGRRRRLRRHGDQAGGGPYRRQRRLRHLDRAGAQPAPLNAVEAGGRSP